MAGITFPNVAGTLAPLMQLDLAAERNAFDRERARRADEADTREREASQHVPAALGGDREALSRIAVASPGLLTKLVPMLDRMDAAARTRAKEATEWTARAAMGVLSLPPDQRPAAYQAALAEGQSLGFKIDMPPQYDRAVEGRLNQILNQTRTFENYWKDKNEGVTFAPPAGGAPAQGGTPPDREAFVQTMMPHALEVSKATGLDPRLVIAQAALETGYGRSAPGNNMFGIKSHGRPGGQTLNTTEAGPNGMYGTRESFRTYGNAGDSARDYVDFLKTNSRYQPVLAAQGIDAQIEAMGRSGYATDPNYAAKLRQIVQSLPSPQIAQGDSIPGSPASGGGNVPPAMAPLRGLQLPPGARVALKGGVPIVKDGTVLYLDANGGWDAVPLPQRAAPKEQGTGPFGGNSVEAQALNMLIANGTLTQAQAAELAAGKTITNPADGSVLFMTPSGIFGQKPGQAPQPVGSPVTGPQSAPAAPVQGQPAAPMPSGAAPAAPAGTPAGVIPITGPKPTKPETMTESQAKAYGFAQRMATANSLLDDLAIQGTSKRGRFLEGLPGGIGNIAQTPEFQRFEQAKRNFMNAQLRDESGAVIGPSEFMSADLQYFPQPGQATNKELLAQMAENRRQVVEAMMIKAGMLKRGERYDPPAKAVDSAEKGRLLFEAKKAIQEGRDPNGVREKLKKLGVDPAELDGAN